MGHSSPLPYEGVVVSLTYIQPTYYRNVTVTSVMCRRDISLHKSNFTGIRGLIPEDAGWTLFNFIETLREDDGVSTINSPSTLRVEIRLNLDRILNWRKDLTRLPSFLQTESYKLD